MICVFGAANMKDIRDGHAAQCLKMPDTKLQSSSAGPARLVIPTLRIADDSPILLVPLPGRRGIIMPLKQLLTCWLILLGMTAMGFVEVVMGLNHEYLGVARGAPQRPRSVYQQALLIFFYRKTDLPLLWEMGRQSFWVRFQRSRGCRHLAVQMALRISVFSHGVRHRSASAINWPCRLAISGSPNGVFSGWMWSWSGQSSTLDAALHLRISSGLCLRVSTVPVGIVLIALLWFAAGLVRAGSCS